MYYRPKAEQTLTKNDCDKQNQLDTGEHSHSMKLKSTLIVVLAVVLLVTAALQAAPRMVQQETTFNFGYVPQNSKVSHVFWLYSKGDDSLQILKVVPG